MSIKSQNFANYDVFRLFLRFFIALLTADFFHLSGQYSDNLYAHIMLAARNLLSLEQKSFRLLCPRSLR